MVERCLLFYNLSRMFLKRLDPGSLPGMTRFLVWGWFVSWAAEVCSAEATELPVGRELRSLWQTDFATPGHWIPGHTVHAD